MPYKQAYTRREVPRGLGLRRNEYGEYEIPAPPPLRPFDLHQGDLVKIYDSEVFCGAWRLCEVASISTDIVACRDLKIGTMTSFRILDYRQGDGVVKVVHNE